MRCFYLRLREFFCSPSAQFASFRRLLRVFAQIFPSVSVRRHGNLHEQRSFALEKGRRKWKKNDLREEWEQKHWQRQQVWRRRRERNCDPAQFGLFFPLLTYFNLFIYHFNPHIFTGGKTCVIFCVFIFISCFNVTLHGFMRHVLMNKCRLLRGKLKKNV